jgi:hypothetical protein
MRPGYYWFFPSDGDDEAHGTGRETQVVEVSGDRPRIDLCGSLQGIDVSELTGRLIGPLEPPSI